MASPRWDEVHIECLQGREEIMTVARISILRTASDFTRSASDKKAEVERLLDDLEEHFSNMSGFVMGFRFAGIEDENQVGRVSLWKSHQDADQAAMLDHTMAIRSQIHRLIEAGHLETIVELKGNPKNIPS